MGETVKLGNPPIPVILRGSSRARRITLRVSGLDGRVTLTVPQRVRKAEALEFLFTKEAWLRQHLARQGDVVPVGIGAVLPVEGAMLEVRPGQARRVLRVDNQLLVPGPADRVGARVAGFLKARARDRLAEASDRYAARLGRAYSRLSLRDTRTRWGSCSSRGALSYSWRLILAPPEVLDYVAAHEVAHLVEMNHSPAFWAQVENLFGPYDAPRAWLRREGSDLHRYRFLPG